MSLLKLEEKNILRMDVFMLKANNNHCRVSRKDGNLKVYTPNGVKIYGSI